MVGRGKIAPHLEETFFLFCLISFIELPGSNLKILTSNILFNSMTLHKQRKQI